MTIDIRKHILPEEIEVDGALYAIHTDYTYFINFIEAMKNPEAKVEDFNFMYADQSNLPADLFKGVDRLSQFCYPKEELPNVDEEEHSHKRAFDYVTDSTMIYAAFMQVYHIDLIDTPLHWHKFLALFNNLSGTRLNEVMGYRGFDKSDKEDYEHRMQRLQEMWELEEIITPEEEALNDKFNAQFD